MKLLVGVTIIICPWIQQKTKEIIFDFRKNNTQYEPLRIHGEIIEQVHEYIYLGTVIDDKLCWRGNCLTIQRKTNQRMFFLRKLKKFHVDRTIWTLFYQSIIQSVMTFNSICTFGNLTNEQKGKMDRIRTIAQRVHDRLRINTCSIIVWRTCTTKSWRNNGRCYPSTQWML